MGAYDGLTKYLGKDLTYYAEKLEYDRSNILILSDDIEALSVEYPDIFRNMFSCKHQADNRSPLDYAKDLIASWIFEDLIVLAIDCDDVHVSITSADRERIILPDTKTSSASDFTVSSDGAEVKMELVNDYTGFWEKWHKLHLRDYKYDKLKKEGSVLLAISLIDNKARYAILDFREEVPGTYIENHGRWGKPAYEIDISANQMHDFTRHDVRDSLFTILKQPKDA